MVDINRSYNHISEGNSRLDIRAFRHRITLVRVSNIRYSVDDFAVMPSVEKSTTIFGCYMPPKSGYRDIDGQSLDTNATATVYLRQWPFDLDLTWRVDISNQRFRILSIDDVEVRGKYLKLTLTKLGLNTNNISMM